MLQTLPFFIVCLAPLLFILTAIYSHFQPGIRPKAVKALASFSALVSIATSIWMGVNFYTQGFMESQLIGFEGIGFSIRLDLVSIIMFSMIALLSFIIIKYSENYLDGDKRQGAFTGRLAAAFASVQLLVLSGNLGILFLAWIFTSISLHRLLIFYPKRPGALIAARKKFIMARFADASLLIAVSLLYIGFGTGNLESIFQAVSGSLPVPTGVLEMAAIFIATAALFKSAQFPTHGWLIEVMETPTPVSSLLHAGLLNAGPFLIIRMAYVMEATQTASILLIVAGGFTALFASVVFLTQTSVKTALGYSSIAHMGFSLMVSGMGAFPAAMLHLVAHSFYKGHAFLSSGSVIDTLRSINIKKPKRSGNMFYIILGLIFSLGAFFGISKLFGLDLTTDIPLLFIGGVIVLGISKLAAQSLDSNALGSVILRSLSLTLLVVGAFFLLEGTMHALLAPELPEPAVVTIGEAALLTVLFTGFLLAIMAQTVGPTLTPKKWHKRLELHLRNGLYVNTVLDRWIGAWYIKPEPYHPIDFGETAAKKKNWVEKVLEEQTIEETSK